MTIQQPAEMNQKYATRTDENTVPIGYKQTEIGVIPEDWDVKRLGECGQTIIGLTYSPNDVSEFGTLVLRSSNVQNGKLAYHDNVFVNMQLPERVMVKEGDILVCVRNGSRQLIGKCALIDKAAVGAAFGAFMSIYRSDANKFIFYQFQSNSIQEQINERMGATINQITNKDMAEFIVAIPKSKKEQTAITNALSDVDALINGLEKLISKKQSIKTATMQQLLTGRTRLPQFALREDGSKKGYKQSELGAIPEDWEVKPLGDFVEICSGESPSKFQFLSDGVPYFKVEQLNNGLVYADETPYYIQTLRVVPAGSIIFPKRGASILSNKIRVLKRDSFMDTNLMALTCTSEIDVLYLHNQLTYRGLDSVADTTSIPQINNKHINPYLLPCTTKEEQTAIATILSDMDAELHSLEQRLNKTCQIKQGMMQELLTGKTRLIQPKKDECKHA